MKQKILQTIKKYNLIQDGDKIVIGVSGGPDSICLLHILNDLKNELNFEIYVAHDKVYELYKDKEGWAKKCLKNIANATYFSSDRTINEYVKDIWKLEKLK